MVWCFTTERNDESPKIHNNLFLLDKYAREHLPWETLKHTHTHTHTIPLLVSDSQAIQIAMLYRFTPDQLLWSCFNRWPDRSLDGPARWREGSVGG